MKESIVCALLLAAGTMAVHSQGLDGTKARDNWSVGVNGGVVTPLANSPFWGGMRANMGISVGKQLTPIIGFDLEGMWSINTSESKTVFDNSNLSLLGRVNLMNLFAGYKGYPRLFEIEGVAGFGWIHGYGKNRIEDAISSKAGFNLNFNVGAKKAWTIALKPAVLWKLKTHNKKNQFNVNYSAFQLNAGVVYHFSGSNGKSYFTYMKPYNQKEVDNLNSTIALIRTELGDTRNDLYASNAESENLKNQLDNLNIELQDCLSREPVVETIATRTLESVITFGQGQTSIAGSQVPNVERIATYLKNNKGSQVVIKGYASPEGNAEVNARIATARAESVKNMLIQRYGIASSRILAEGQGVGDMFTEPDWNRVSICTIVED